MLLKPVVLAAKDETPAAVFPVPEVLLTNDEAPVAVF